MSDLVQRKRERFGRSVDELAEGEIVDMDMGRLKEMSEGAEEERGTVAEEAISRQKRTIPGLPGPVAALGAAAAGAVPLVAAPLVAAVGAGPLVAGHFAKKLGFKAGLHHALKGRDVKQALVKKPQVKVKQDPVCKQVPVERCTTSKQCDQVQVEKCEKVPVETCNQVPNTKCRTIPQEICNVVTNKHCKKVPHQICENVPHPRCVSVPHKVCEIIPEEKCWKEPSETCWEEPVQKCHQVPEERCWQEPHQSCRDEPREICHDKTVRLEKKVCVHETKKTEVPASLQSSSLTTGTSTFMRVRAKDPPSDVVPQPETVHMCPEGYSCPEDGIPMVSMTEELRSALSASQSMQMSSSYRLWLPTLTPNLLADCPSQQCPAVMTLLAATKDPPHIKEPPTPPLRRAI